MVTEGGKISAEEIQCVLLTTLYILTASFKSDPGVLLLHNFYAEYQSFMFKKTCFTFVSNFI